jgi:plasmid stabilization system protein ParE
VVEISLNAAAEVEYEIALAWYLERNDRAAAGFEAAIDRAMEHIAMFPEASPLCDVRHRYKSLKRYPYGVIYRFDGIQVRVVAITHDRQLPGFWIDRE